jgi:succinate dehydrogenase/fumarate reductase flavoprotein subunit
VLDNQRRPIPGLYAAGNDIASIMGGDYPGAGITLGPALTFGYIAGCHLAGVPADYRRGPIREEDERAADVSAAAGAEKIAAMRAPG